MYDEVCDGVVSQRCICPVPLYAHCSDVVSPIGNMVLPLKCSE